MMKILTISGSTQKNSNNDKLLKGLPQLLPIHEFIHFEEIVDFPLFSPDKNNAPPTIIKSFRALINTVDLVIISTPEYTYNIPAVLKNALEWITSSGELNEKKVLAITYTPYAPRGEKAMQSLVWSLLALNAKIVAQLPLYQSKIKTNEKGELAGDESIEALKAVIDFI